MNNREAGWGAIQSLAFVVTLIIFVKCLGFYTLYAMRRLFDNVEDQMMRPRSVTPEDGLNLESFAYITAYLLEKEDENIDANTGATPAHDFVANENDLEMLD
jgi:hypothetical protein